MKNGFYLLSVFALVMLFQNCGGQFSSNETAPTNNDHNSPQNQNVLDPGIIQGTISSIYNALNNTLHAQTIEPLACDSTCESNHCVNLYVKNDKIQEFELFCSTNLEESHPGNIEKTYKFQIKGISRLKGKVIEISSDLPETIGVNGGQRRTRQFIQHLETATTFMSFDINLETTIPVEFVKNEFKKNKPNNESLNSLKEQFSQINVSNYLKSKNILKGQGNNQISFNAFYDHRNQDLLKQFFTNIEIIAKNLKQATAKPDDPAPQVLLDMGNQFLSRFDSDEDAITNDMDCSPFDSNAWQLQNFYIKEPNLDCGLTEQSFCVGDRDSYLNTSSLVTEAICTDKELLASCFGHERDVITGSSTPKRYLHSENMYSYMYKQGAYTASEPLVYNTTTHTCNDGQWEITQEPTVAENYNYLTYTRLRDNHLIPLYYKNNLGSYISLFRNTYVYNPRYFFSSYYPDLNSPSVLTVIDIETLNIEYEFGVRDDLGRSLGEKGNKYYYLKMDELTAAKEIEGRSQYKYNVVQYDVELKTKTVLTSIWADHKSNLSGIQSFVSDEGLILKYSALDSYQNATRSYLYKRVWLSFLKSNSYSANPFDLGEVNSERVISIEGLKNGIVYFNRSTAMGYYSFYLLHAFDLNKNIYLKLFDVPVATPTNMTPQELTVHQNKNLWKVFFLGNKVLVLTKNTYDYKFFLHTFDPSTISSGNHNYLAKYEMEIKNWDYIKQLDDSEVIYTVRDSKSLNKIVYNNSGALDVSNILTSDRVLGLRMIAKLNNKYIFSGKVCSDLACNTFVKKLMSYDSIEKKFKIVTNLNPENEDDFFDNIWVLNGQAYVKSSYPFLHTYKISPEAL
ncbi:MAG: hypothetical protein HOO06_06350 [Bdellovibrionaceae bacterium]|jgi:hypothetical protein|nr:hypothetical protein [Pseudobdellovibrionaceae bacterium]